MKHHLQNPDYPFVKNPIRFDKYTDRIFLQYCLGATLYMPGTKNFSDLIISGKYPGLTSTVCCFEDSCPAEKIPEAEENCLSGLDFLSKNFDEKFFSERMPLLFFRVRNLEQFKNFSERLKPEHIKFITGFVFPKFNSETGEKFFRHLEMLNEKFGEILYAMPIIEDKLPAFKETRHKELSAVSDMLEKYKNFVLNVRVGCTDFSSLFGVRRDVDCTIYDIAVIKDILVDVLNFFNRSGDYVLSGPVWEYFRVNKKMKFAELPEPDMQQALLRRIPLINPETDGLIREIMSDKANGFVGKTVIHPSHIKFVNGIYAVTKEEYEDALQILNLDDGVIKSKNANKMNEIKPHRSWAERIVRRAEVYGVIKNRGEYQNLFV